MATQDQKPVNPSIMMSDESTSDENAEDGRSILGCEWWASVASGGPWLRLMGIPAGQPFSSRIEIGFGFTR